MEGVHKTECAEIWKDSSGIVHSIITTDKEITLSNAQENVEAMKLISNGDKIDLFTDARLVKKVSKEAKDFSSSINIIRHNAILVDSPLTKVLGNMFLAVTGPKFNAKLFTSESEAVT